MDDSVANTSTTPAERVQLAAGSLTAAERRIAALIVDDPSGAAQMTISDLATRAGTSESTVVRTARTLGYTGYPELRLALAAAGASTAPSAMHTLTGDIERDDTLEVAVEKLASVEVAALRATFGQLDLAALRSVVDAIVGARRVDVYGFGVSGLVAADLWQKLMRIGRNCHAFTESHLALTSAALLSPDDVVLAISYSGEVTDVLEPVRLAKRLGVTVIALTSQPKSALAKLADIVLVAAGRTEPLLPGAMGGRMSQLLVTDAIFVGVAQHDYDGALRALRHTTAALDARRQRRGPAR
jgi:DNA-binding MurR/RpiR family transcriptional regulator